MTKQAVEARGPRHLLTRILETPHLAQVVQALEPRVLHQLVRHCGLEDCGEIVALATSQQLMRVFDDDLWRSDEGGEEDQFDADRFGVWLEVLAELGAAAAAQKIALMDFDFVTAALSRYVLVLDQETLLLGQALAEWDDYDPIEQARAVLAANGLEDRPRHETGGFTVIAKRSESWDALVSILIHIEDAHRAFFVRLMKRCSHFPTELINDNGGLYEVLTADEQVMADIAIDREKRREREGYVTPSQAVAFLKVSRERHDRTGTTATVRDPVTAGYFRELGPRESTTDPHVAHFLAALEEGGVLGKPAPPLLLTGEAAGPDRLSRIRAALQLAQERDATVYARRAEELAYLANVLIAGCSFESRRFRPSEAAEAVLATCNLGLENSPNPPDDLLLHQDLVAVFQTGWSVLYEDVCLHTARRLVEILSDLDGHDTETHDQLEELRRRMKLQLDAGTPWRERDNLDVLAILDQPSWSTLLGLIDECPVLRRAAEPSADGRRPLRMPSGFDFISENRQVAGVRDFVDSLPERLA